MIGFVRAVTVAATLTLGLTSALAADKAFRRDELGDSGIRLEAQIKTEAGAVNKTVAALKTDIDAAFRRNDMRGGLQLLGQLVSVAPQESVNWLRLARTILQIRPADNREKTFLLERASTAAYLAYQRAGKAGEESEALAVIGKAMADRQIWRPALDALRLSLDLREVADVRGQYEKLRDDHGFRLLDYSVDSDSASPRVCFQFSEDLAKRTDFTPFVAQVGVDKPAITTEDQQLCVEGLKHGERYTMNLRSGLPSTVRESLPKSAEFNIYVRDRKPFVRFTSRAYVLPRTGQRGIPLVSVNTPAVSVKIFRIGDRNLINTVLSSDFQSSLSSYDLTQLGDEKGVKVWSGEVATGNKLNEDVTTAFPVDEAVGEMQPGVYVMTATAKKAASSEDDESSYATQWFIVSDMGVTAFSGNDGIHVFVNALTTAGPVAKTDVRLVARNNEILAMRKTDEAGHVLFEAGLGRGEGGLSPALVTVTSEKGDYAFLSLKSSAFDLSDRGVAGRAVPAGPDAFVYTERGVYRSSETVYVTALLRDGQGNAVAGAPLTLVVERPDGVEYRRSVVADQGAGGRTLTLPLNSAVPAGTWRVRAFTDPKGKSVGETTFMVEDYVPDRIEFDLTAKSAQIAADKPAQLQVDGHFLYGAPASALTLEGDVLVTKSAGRPGYDGYQFGVPDDPADSNERTAIDDLPETDASGKATFSVSLSKQPSAVRLSEAQVFIRMVETGGRAVERKLTIPVAPVGAMIGVKPLFIDKNVAEGDPANFDVVFVDTEGKALARSGLRYELLKLESRYQWYRQGSSWDFEPVKTTRRVADGTLDVSADKPSRIQLAPQPGRYRLDVKEVGGADSALTSVQFDVGWYSDGSADTPDLLETSIDKAAYASGDTMTVNVTARSAGKLTVNVIGDRLLTTQSVDLKEGAAQVKIPVGSDWGTGAYVVTTLRRPLDVAAQRMPSRAIGLKWFSIDRATRTLAVSLSAPGMIRPNTTLKLPVKITGLSRGEDAKIVIAAVDVGILNLTGYKPPAPDDYYLGQRRLTTEIRDLYGQLIDGMQGTRGQIRSGGDSASAELQGSPPTQKPLALFSGIVTVGADGSVEVPFAIPEFAGTARVMAVAWTATKVGRANADVVVRDPVVLTATLPRFLLNGDRGSMTMELDNVEGAAGDYVIGVRPSGPVRLSGNPATTMRLAAKQRSSVQLALDAVGAGTAQLDVDIKGPNGLSLTRQYALDVKPATQVLARRTVRTLAKGESLTLSPDIFSDLVAGTGAVSVSMSLSSALDAASVLKALDRYPFGCSEQITSRAMPLLYVNDLAAEAQLALDSGIDQRIRDAIDRLLARQGSNGSFGLWSAGGEDAWLDAYVTDFLTRAREKGFAVPDVAFRQAVDRLRNTVANAEEPEKDGGRDLAYALYVLARNGAAPVGDLRYLADTKLANIATPIAKAQLAAALALVGDRTRAERVYQSALTDLQPKPTLVFGRTDYGSALRDAAALVSLASEGNAPRATLTSAVQRVEEARGLTPYTSTQENAWLVLAARALAREQISLDVDGAPVKTALYRSYKQADITGKPVRITNTGDAPMQAVISVSGAPVTPEPAASNGFTIERSYHTLDGKPADVSKARQNDRFAVVLKITEARPVFGRLMVVDYLPAGLEIDNPHLVSSGDTGTLDWIEDGEEAEHTEFRDDRFNAAIERAADDSPVFTVAYIVRAVSPGKYVLPQAYVEDMYNPSRYGRTNTGSVEITAKK